MEHIPERALGIELLNARNAKLLDTLILATKS